MAPILMSCASTEPPIARAASNPRPSLVAIVIKSSLRTSLLFSSVRSVVRACQWRADAAACRKTVQGTLHNDDGVSGRRLSLYPGGLSVFGRRGGRAWFRDRAHAFSLSRAADRRLQARRRDPSTS